MPHKLECPYWLVTQSVSGWRIFRIPVEICETAEEAEALVDNCDAYAYVADEEDDYLRVETVELRGE